MTGPRLALLLVLSGAVFMEGVDVSMMGVALPSIRAELGMSTSELQWVVSAYVLGYGGFVLLGGRAADLLGRRRMFLLWMAVFVVFSGLGGIASEGWLVIVARFVTGVAAGFMAPAGLSIITTSFSEGRERNRALLIYAGVAAAGFSLGMVVGGLLTAIGWRWVFFAPVRDGAGCCSPSPTASCPRDDARARRGASTSPARWRSPPRWSCSCSPSSGRRTSTSRRRSPALSASLALLTRVRARSSAAPQRAARAPRHPAQRPRCCARTPARCCSSAPSSPSSSSPCSTCRSCATGRRSRPGSRSSCSGIDAILAPTLTPRLVERFGKLPVIGAGTALAALGYALFLRLGADWTYFDMLPTLLLVGVAFALTFGTLMIVATDGIDEHEQGLAGGLQYVSLQFGAAVGLAIVAAVNVAATNGTSSEALLDGYRTALLVPVALAALALAVTATGLTRYGLTSSRSGSGVGSTA